MHLQQTASLKLRHQQYSSGYQGRAWHGLNILNGLQHVVCCKCIATVFYRWRQSSFKDLLEGT
ncbi:hypothetical protein, partial [Serratia marcescens]|uniref:hypothetical protein n=1 Tax=Serratia marcescens TaxID=615 RepID=UPI001BCD95B2